MPENPSIKLPKQDKNPIDDNKIIVNTELQTQIQNEKRKTEEINQQLLELEAERQRLFDAKMKLQKDQSQIEKRTASQL